MFSILIPTWNNFSYLKNCIESIRQHSTFDHEIIVHVNDGRDGSLDWVKQEGLLHTSSEHNIGICLAMNKMTQLASKDFIAYFNDDMYALPGWDKVLKSRMDQFGEESFMISATMIEPTPHHNPCVIVADYGTTLTDFQEKKLLDTFDRFEKKDWNGSTWPPNVVRKSDWLKVGGYSIEFSPGMSSDDDFAMKMWQIGCRNFIGVAESRVYHFQTKSTGRIIKNNGRQQFLMKWGIAQSAFHRLFTKRGTEFSGPLTEPDAKALKFEQQKGWLKRKLW